MPGVPIGEGVGVKVGVPVGVAVPVGVGVTDGVTVGVGVGPPQACVDEELRGFGSATKKSLALLFVSMQPPSARKSDIVLLGAGAGPEPSEQLAVAP